MNKTLYTPIKFALVLPLALLLLAMAAAGILLGLAASESGTRFLLGQAQRWTGEFISWQKVEGNLLGPLRLGELSVWETVNPLRAL